MISIGMLSLYMYVRFLLLHWLASSSDELVFQDKTSSALIRSLSRATKPRQSFFVKKGKKILEEDVKAQRAKKPRTQV